MQKSFVIQPEPAIVRALLLVNGSSGKRLLPSRTVYLTTVGTVLDKLFKQ